MKKILYVFICLTVVVLPVSYAMQTQSHGVTTLWECTIMVTEPNGLIDTSIFGEASDATDGPPPDSYDAVKPPAPPAPCVRTWFDDNLPVPYDLLWKDYRSYPDTEKVWNLTVQWVPSSGSSPTLVTIYWSIDEVAASEYFLVSLCNDTGAMLKNMLLHSSYSFNCPAYIPQYFRIICAVNLPPATPQQPSGETAGNTGVDYTYSTTTTDPNNHQLYYQWNWGDGTTSAWLGPFDSGQISQATHSWTKKGNYEITVKAKDSYGAETNWSDPLPITMPASQMAGIDEIPTFFYYLIHFLKSGCTGMIFLQSMGYEKS